MYPVSYTHLVESTGGSFLAGMVSTVLLLLLLIILNTTLYFEILIILSYNIPL